MIGEIAENFILKDQYGNDFELYKNLDKKMLLVFYPKDDSPVCTRQLSNYKRNITEFAKFDINIAAINTAAVYSHLSFCNKLKLNFPVLSDENKQVCRNYKALNLLGLIKRKLVLVNIDRKIIFEKVVLPFYYIKAEKLLKEVIL